jgi:FMN phosphatase YigB (HAD superfamily)
MTFKKIIFDFDGVLCHDYFYSNLKISHPAVSKFIEESVFSKNSDMPDKWMRAKLTTDDVNKFISENTGIDFDELSNLFIESVKAMRVDDRLLDLAKKLLLKGKKVALVTNNMDVFNTITIKHHNLDQVFPVIVNSFDYGLMKHDNNGKLFDIAFEKLNESDYSDVLLIDDSSRIRAVFESRGGSTFPYNRFESFEPWMNLALI